MFKQYFINKITVRPTKSPDWLPGQAPVNRQDFLLSIRAFHIEKRENGDSA